MLKGKEGRPGARRDANFVVDVLDVMAYGLGRDLQPVRHLPIGEARGNEAQHLDLAIAQSGGPDRPDRGNYVPGDFQDCLNRLAVQLTGIGFSLKLLCGSLSGVRRTVWSRLGHGLIGIGGRQNTRRRWQQ